MIEIGGQRVADGAIRTSQRLWRAWFPLVTATAGQVRLPIVMTFVVAMFAATMALVWFGYVATREWRSGTNLLLERRANEAAKLVQLALSGDMKGAWITAIVPFTTTNLDEDPPYSMFQVAARTFARFPYPESFVLWKQTAHNEGSTYVFNRADRPPPWETRPSSDDPFPVVLVRDPAALAGLVAAIEGGDGGIALRRVGAANRSDALPDRRARALRVQPAPRTPGIHGLHGQ
jgi:hypothetical protein